MVGKVNKYGVPISDVDDTRQGLLQPKFVNRFRVRFDGLGDIPVNSETSSDESVSNDVDNILTGSVESFTKPTFTFEKQTVNSLTSRAFYTGRPTYDDFNITIRDEITNTVISGIYNQLKMQTYKYQPVTTNSGGSMIKSRFLGMSCKFNTRVEVMDGNTNHTALEIWDFYGCLITSYSSPTLSYEDDQGIGIITLSCSFDYVDVTQPERKQFASDYGYEDGQGRQRKINNIANNLQDGVGVPEDNTSKEEDQSITAKTTRFFRDTFS